VISALLMPSMIRSRAPPRDHLHHDAAGALPLSNPTPGEHPCAS